MDTPDCPESIQLTALMVTLLKKYQTEEVSLNQLECFLNLTWSEREVLRLGKKIPPATVVKNVSEAETKFVMIADLGVITVPKEYVHTAEFVMLHESEYENIRSNDRSVNTGTFLNPNRILKVGDKFRVRAFQKTESSPTTTNELFTLYTKEKAVYLGLQGASLVLEMKRGQLPKGISCISFETKMNLWFPDNTHPVPYVEAISNEEFFTNAISFDFVCQSRDVAFLVFTEVPADTSAEVSAKAGVSEEVIKPEEPWFSNGTR